MRRPSKLDFRLDATCRDTAARAGRLRTLKGEALTPMFMPVATLGAVRGQSHGALERSGATVILANTYHLLLRPGVEALKRLGGLPRLMGWDRGILTDSGGFQIFSLPYARKMTEEGAEFQSYVTGDRHLLTPETSIQIQRAIGSDIRMVLDQCIPSTSEEKLVIEAMELTHRWALRSLREHGDDPQSVFAIVQGACSPKFRRESAQYLTQLEDGGRSFDGFAIGGLAVGETRDERQDMCELAAGLLPADRPRYLMGVGTPIDLLEGVKRGVDLFDCIIPSAWAQQGSAFSWRGRIDLGRGVYKFSEEPIDPDCDCTACTKYTRAFLHHLVKCTESLGWQLVGEHNLRFYQRLTARMRAAILEGRFEAFYREAKPILESGDDLENPKKRVLHPPRKDREERSRRLGDYAIVQNAAGSFSIQQLSSQEIMHSVSDPEAEAHALYVAQPRLKERLLEPGNPRPLVVWDVGLGAAHNAMSAIRLAESLLQPSAGSSDARSDEPSVKTDALKRDLELLSFEIDLDPLRLALRYPFHFKHLRHAAPQRLLHNEYRWHSKDGRIRWGLEVGDFREKFESACLPDVILFDPFSHKTDSELWTVQFFERLAKHLGSHPASLYTYSNSTAVRAALIGAGFWVAAGAPTGPKSETTIAFTPEGWERDLLAREGGARLLGPEWLERWERSSARLPLGASEEERALWEARLRQAPQFRISPSLSS